MSNNTDAAVQLVGKIYSYGMKVGGPAVRSVMSANPDLVSLALLLFILYISLLIVTHTARMVYGFVVNLIRLAVFVSFALAFAWWYIRGTDGVIEDYYYMSSEVVGSDQSYASFTQFGGVARKGVQRVVWNLFSM